MTLETVMNPMLYRRLVRRFGEVKVRNQGQARVVSGQPDFLEDKLTVRQWGETYAIRCPFCRELSFQLFISYLYGQRDEATGRPHGLVAHCLNAHCMARRENREALADMLSAGDGILEDARIRQETVPCPQEQQVELPKLLTRLDKLPKGHPARRYLLGWGYKPNTIGKFYGVCFCPDHQDSLARNRIIIPIYQRGELRGWQSLSIKSSAPDDGKPIQYLSARGMSNTRLLYNLDRARHYHTGIIVRSPARVWAFGPMALCPVGDSFSDHQTRLLCNAFRDRTLVLLLRKDELDRLAVRRQREALVRSMPGRVAVIEIPSGLRQGRAGRKALRTLVREQARAQGVQVTYEKCQ